MQATRAIPRAVTVLLRPASHHVTRRHMSNGFNVDLKGKTAFVAGVADSRGYGWAISKYLAEAGCKVLVGTWPVVLGGFKKALDKGFGEDAVMSNGEEMKIDQVYPLDLAFSNEQEIPPKVLQNKYYAGLSGFDIRSVAAKVHEDHGKIDFLIHSVANGPEVTKPLLQTSRQGYLAASSASAYSMIAMVQEFGPYMNPGGGVISITYIASEAAVPGYGGGMSSAKAQLESDTRTLAFEAGREWGIRVNTISAGPLKSRAASAIGKGLGSDKVHIDFSIDYMKANAPLPEQELNADDVGAAALSLLAPQLSRAITGVTLYVDNGMHAMGLALDSASFADSPTFQMYKEKKGAASE